jgi:hypothetical protein
VRKKGIAAARAFQAQLLAMMVWGCRLNALILLDLVPAEGFEPPTP